MASQTPPPGVITYQLPEGHFYRVAAQEGAAPEDLSLALDKLAPDKLAAGTAETQDDWLNISPDGEWLLLSTDRFDPACAGWPCLALVKSDFSAYEVPRVNGDPVHPASRGAVASGGNLIVYPQGDGPHARDLLAITRGEDGLWSAPAPLTQFSPYDWNDMPEVDAAGEYVVFDCGNAPYGAVGTAICQTSNDGLSFEVVIKPKDTPLGMNPDAALHHADYTPKGGLVFESDWGHNERLWSLTPGHMQPYLITEAFGNDNSPCVLPDGRIVSLWLGRPENSQGYHEIKVMEPDGSAYQMVVTGVDVADAGLGCGAGPTGTGPASTGK